MQPSRLATRHTTSLKGDLESHLPVMHGRISSLRDRLHALAVVRAIADTADQPLPFQLSRPRADGIRRCAL